MNYNTLLDTFFSNWYINLGLLALIIILLLIYRVKFVFSYYGKIWFGILFFGMIFIWFMTILLFNAMLLGYGHANGVDGILSADGKLYVVDYLHGGGSRISGPSKYSRVHILDAETGNKILRFTVGEHGELTGVKGDSLIIYGGNLLNIFSSSNGKLIAKLDRKTLPKIFPELSSGIDHVMISNAEKILELTTMDGNHFNLSMRTAELFPDKQNKTREQYSPTNKIHLHNDNEIEIDDRPGERVLIELRGKDNNQEIRYLKGRNGDVINELKFIMGEFVAVSENQKCFAVQSFETTKKIGFILTGVSLDGKNKLWELKQSELRPDDDSKYPITTSWNLDKNGEVLYFAMKDEVMALEILTGKIFWRVKL